MALSKPVGLEAIVWYVAFVVSTTAHEAAHALAAYLGGDPTAYRAGQVTLNPVPHMRREPFGMIVFPLIGLFSGGFCLGWASTPYDPRWERRHPRRAAWMAAAGPGANLLIATAALLALWLGLASGLFYPPDAIGYSRLVASDLAWADGLGRFLSILLLLNAILCLFNLIPMPPLDGATAITLLAPAGYAQRLRRAFSHPPVMLATFLALILGFGLLVPAVWKTLADWLHPGLYAL